MRRRLALLALLGLVAAAPARPANASCAFPYNLQNGQTADAGQVMADLNAIVGCLGVQRSYLAGLTLSNDGTSPNTVLDVAAGMAADSSNATNIALPSTLAKATQGAWAAGANSNAMGTGLTIAANTWYHVFAIVNGGNADVYFDTSPTAANAPNGTTAFRRLGSFKTDGAAHILAFSQNGDEFIWAAAAADISVSNLGTTATLYTLSVPPGLKMWVLQRGYGLSSTDGANVFITSPDENDETAGLSMLTTSFTNPYYTTGGHFQTRTNANQQIRLRATSASTTVVLNTYGWIDRRGRDN